MGRIYGNKLFTPSIYTHDLSFNSLHLTTFHFASRNEEGHNGTINPSVPTGSFSYDITNSLHACSKYDIALGVKIKDTPKTDWLYSIVRVLTLPNKGMMFDKH